MTTPWQSVVTVAVMLETARVFNPLGRCCCHHSEDEARDYNLDTGCNDQHDGPQCEETATITVHSRERYGVALCASCATEWVDSGLYRADRINNDAAA